MLLRSENFTNDEGIEMIREYYGEILEDGSEEITTIHERPAEVEVVVEPLAKESSVQEVKDAIANIKSGDAKESSIQEVKDMVEEIKKSSASTESSMMAMDDLLLASLAAIQCCGVVGQTFTLTNSNTGAVKTYTITENDDFGDSGYREKRIFVPLGTWTCHVNTPDIGEATADIEATQVGYVYMFKYDTVKIISTHTTSGAFTVPDTGVYRLYVTAAAGGGGGASGDTGNGGYGGSGGAGGDCVHWIPINKKSGDTISFTIGNGGTGGAYAKSGSAGTSTVVGDIVTLLGGNPGVYKEKEPGGKIDAGTGGGHGGYTGGSGGDSVIPGGNGGPCGHYTRIQSGTGGGGGGGYGIGGTGGDYVDAGGSDGRPGGYGAGGGGGGYKCAGGSGGNGIVEFCKGVRVL